MLTVDVDRLYQNRLRPVVGLSLRDTVPRWIYIQLNLFPEIRFLNEKMQSSLPIAKWQI